jgi:hypothetical protein
MQKTFRARGRIALSDGGLRPRGTGRRICNYVSIESERNLWAGVAQVKALAD